MQKRVYPLYFAVPALLLYTLLYIYPSLVGVGYAFTDLNRYTSDVHYVGFLNFQNIFISNKPYLHYIGNTLMFTLVSNIVKIIPALFLALMLVSGIRGMNVYRSVMFFPYILSTLVVCLIFQAMIPKRPHQRGAEAWDLPPGRRSGWPTPGGCGLRSSLWTRGAAWAT
jgi:raffinose/stachyose/melibiose transport system permease protein